MGTFSGENEHSDQSKSTSNSKAMHGAALLDDALSQQDLDSNIQPTVQSNAHKSARKSPSPSGAAANTLNVETNTPDSHVKDHTIEYQVRGKRRNASHWSVADIQWDRIDRERVRNDQRTYYVVTAASFVETAAELYTANLVEHFPDPGAQQWLVNYWKPEELQHGLALRTYVETVWPELDWQRGYEGFLSEYSQMCTMDELEDSRALEMVARCVVEAGTSTFYTTIQNSTDERVLKDLAGLIRQDEVSHYNHFRHYFETYQREEGMGRMGVVRSLYKRFTEAENEDAYIGLKHAWLMRHPGETFQTQQFEEVTHDLRVLLRGHYPYRMALKMLLQPLALNRTLVKYSLPLLERAARRFMFRG